MREVPLEEKKKILLSIMDSIDSFCAANSLTYLLGYGSLLGAVRHKGFIPWDDDIDIVMPRPDFERFLRTYKDEGYAISRYTDKSFFPINVTKVYAVNTYGILSGKINLNYGIAIDIFVMDGLPSEENMYNKLYRKYLRLNKRYMRCLYYETIVSVRSMKNVLQRLYKLVFNTRRQAAKLERLVSSCSFDSAELMGNIFATYSLKKYDKQRYLPSSDYQFEDRVYKGPADYDYVLSVQYGSDYMTPPPEKGRESLHGEKYYYCE